MGQGFAYLSGQAKRQLSNGSLLLLTLHSPRWFCGAFPASRELWYAVSMRDSTAAAILAGGKSRRMGTNKALLRLGEHEPTMIECVVARLGEAGFRHPLIVTNSPEEYAFLGLEMVPDEVPGAGPLAGILSALTHSQSEHALVVACDMPLLNPALLAYMASIPAEYHALVPRWTDPLGQIRVESMHAIYSTACVEPIRRRLAAGKRHAFGLFEDEDVAVRYIEEAELRRFDPDLRSLRNINTPEEWEMLRGEQA